jgi:hypothetical protein
VDSGLSALGASVEWLVTRPTYLVTEAEALEGYRSLALLADWGLDLGQAPKTTSPLRA